MKFTRPGIFHTIYPIREPTGLPIHHFRNDQRTGDEMRPAIGSGNVTGDAPVSYWPMFSLSLVTVP